MNRSFNDFNIMTTTSGTILLNAGLPWTNPLKIQIGSDEHIIDTTINRGLMMLLNNDYYLDAKTSVLSKELSSVIDNVDILSEILSAHINNHAIHEAKQLSTVIQNITYETIAEATQNYNDEGLPCDTIKYIPIDWPAVKINELIKNTPHNLNTYTLIFLFVVPDGYTNNSKDGEYVCDIGSDSIVFSDFYNGNLFVLGDYLHSKTPPYTPKEIINLEKSENAIKNPIKYDGVNLQKYISDLQEDILKPELINDIIESEDEGSFYKDRLKKIKIRGDALNNDYSLVAFKNVSARTYVKNLAFASSLNPDTEKKDALVIEDFNSRTDLPTNERFILMYPFEENGDPIIGYAIKNQINTIENEDNVRYLKNINDLVSSSITTISSHVYDSESGLIHQFDVQMNALDNPDTDKDRLMLTKDQIGSMKNTFKNETNQIITEISALIPEDQINAYITDGEFKNDLFNSKIAAYQRGMTEYKESLSALFNYSGLQAFLLDRTDLASALVYTSGTFDDYKALHLNPALSSIDAAMMSSSIKFGNMINWLNDDEGLLSSFTLVSSDFAKTLQYPSAAYISDIDKKIKFDNEDNVCHAIDFKHDSESGFSTFTLSTDDITTDVRKKFFFDSLFSTHKLIGITEKHSSTEDGDFTSSLNGATICYWIRRDAGSLQSDNGYLEFDLANEYEDEDQLTTSNFRLLFNQLSIQGIRCTDDNCNEQNKEILSGLSNGSADRWEMHQWFLNKNADNSLSVKRKVLAYKIEEGTKHPIVDIIESDPLRIDSNIFLNDYKSCRMTIGCTVDDSITEQSPSTANHALHCRLRNLAFFIGSLTDAESRALFYAGIRSIYNLPYENSRFSILELVNSGQFYLGLLGVYSVNNINILNCVMKYKGKSYLVK